MEKSTKSMTTSQKKTNDHNSSFAEEFAQLNQDVQMILGHLKSSGSELTKEVSQEVWNRVENVASRIAEINNRVTSSAGDFIATQYTKTKEKTEECAENLERNIKAHPISSVAISFGIGLLISKVIGSWHSSR